MDTEQRISKFGMKLEKANTEKELEEWKAEAAPEEAAADGEGRGAWCSQQSRDLDQAAARLSASQGLKGNEII